MSIKKTIKKVAKPSKGMGAEQKGKYLIFNMAKLAGLSTFSPEPGSFSAKKNFWKKLGDEVIESKVLSIEDDAAVTGKELVKLIFSNKYDMLSCLGIMHKYYGNEESSATYGSARNLFVGFRIAQLELNEYLLNVFGLRDFTSTRDIERVGDEYAEKLEGDTFTKGEELGEHIEKEITQESLSAIKKKKNVTTVRSILQALGQTIYAPSQTTFGVGATVLWEGKGKESLERFEKNIMRNPKLSDYFIEDIKGKEIPKLLSVEGLGKILSLSLESDEYRFGLLELLGAMNYLAKKEDSFKKLVKNPTWLNLFRLYLVETLVQNAQDVFFTVAEGRTNDKTGSAIGERFDSWRLTKEYLDILEPKEFIKDILS